MKLALSVSLQIRILQLSGNCTGNIQTAKGGVQMLLAKQFVDFILRDINVTKFLLQLDTKSLTDEIFWQSINYDPVLQV